MTDNKKYIYNVHFANYLINHGVTCIGTGINKSTGRFYWVFRYDECQPIYEERYGQKGQAKNWPQVKETQAHSGLDGIPVSFCIETGLPMAQIWL